jgi:RNA polymerase primary sigma factor/RNA polymerase sigma factor
MKIVDLEVLKTFTKIYFTDESFDKNGANLQIMKQMPDYQKYLEDKNNIEDKRVGIMQACSDEPILSKEQQLHLFRHYNYLKYRIANRITQKLTPKRHSEVSALYWKARKIGNLLASSNFKLIGEEFVGEVYASILKSVDLFDWRRGFCFSTYATWAVKNNLLKVQQKHRKTITKYQSLTKLVNNKDFDPVSMYSTVSEVCSREDTMISEDLLNLLDPVREYRERFILTRMFGFAKTLPHENTLKAVGKELNIT